MVSSKKKTTLGTGNGGKKTRLKPPQNQKQVPFSQMATPLEDDTAKICWHLRKLDIEHQSWGMLHVGIKHFLDEILCKMKDFETRTWAEIKGGKQNHSIAVDLIEPVAQKRLQELGLDDLDSVFSLRLTGTKRLFGIRTGRVFEVLWYDPEHEICPSLKKHT